MAIHLPVLCSLAIVTIDAATIYDPNINGLLYAALPAKYQTSLTFLITFIEETRFYTFGAVAAIQAWQVQILTFDNLMRRLFQLTQSKAHPHRDDQTLRNLQLHVNLFNTIHRHIIFSYKMVCLAISITCGYAAITSLADNPIFGTMYCVLFSENAAIYSLIYQKAFSVPNRFQEAKRKALIKVQTAAYTAVLTKFEKMVLQRKIRSVQSAGIKVGEFHTLERISTPMFIHYILQNICTMLLSVRKRQ